MPNFVNLLDIIYPVGSMYFSVNNVSPADSVGGTWEQIKDAVLAASGNSYSGAVDDYHGNKAMTVNQMPRHSHIAPERDVNQTTLEQWEYCFHVYKYGSSGGPEGGGRYTKASSSAGNDIMRFVSSHDAQNGGGRTTFHIIIQSMYGNVLPSIFEGVGL